MTWVFHFSPFGPLIARIFSVRSSARRTRAWEPPEAGYLAFGERRAFHLAVDDGPKGAAALADGQRRLLDAIDQIERGSFPPRPFSRRICSYCAYATVCRKDYVDGE
jgi:hypothetical protein